MDLSIGYNKSSSASEAKEKVLKSLTPETFKKFGVTAKVEDYSEDEVRVSGKGFDVSAEFLESSVEITVKLSLLLRPLKGKIVGSIKKQFEKII